MSNIVTKNTPASYDFSFMLFYTSPQTQTSPCNFMQPKAFQIIVTGCVVDVTHTQLNTVTLRIMGTWGSSLCVVYKLCIVDTSTKEDLNQCKREILYEIGVFTL